MNKRNPIPCESEIEDVLKCSCCGTFHFDSRSRCPNCGSDLYWQTSEGCEDRADCARIGIQQRSKRRFFGAISEADDITIEWMKGELDKVAPIEQTGK